MQIRKVIQRQASLSDCSCWMLLSINMINTACAFRTMYIAMRYHQYGPAELTERETHLDPKHPRRYIPNVKVCRDTPDIHQRPMKSSASTEGIAQGCRIHTDIVELSVLYAKLTSTKNHIVVHQHELHSAMHDIWHACRRDGCVAIADKLQRYMGWCTLWFILL